MKKLREPGTDLTAGDGLVLINRAGSHVEGCHQSRDWGGGLPENRVGRLPSSVRRLAVPEVIAAAGTRACFKFLEFFAARIENIHTRRAYHRSSCQFCSWLAAQGIPLDGVLSPHVAAYLQELKLRQYAKPTIKQHLAAVRQLLDWLVVGNVLLFNPAAPVRGPKHVVTRGTTPILSEEEATHLLSSIDTSHVVGARDKALIATLIYTFCRIDAALEMDVGRSYYPQGKKWWVRLQEKNGKVGQLPAHHLLEEALDRYLAAAGGPEAFPVEDGYTETSPAQRPPQRRPLFRTTLGRTKQLTNRRLTQSAAWKMVRRRAADAGIDTPVGNHSFRATGITNFLVNGGSLEKAQKMAMHSSIRTTKLYDRTDDQITLDEVERITIGRSTDR